MPEREIVRRSSVTTVMTVLMMLHLTANYRREKLISGYTGK